MNTKNKGSIWSGLKVAMASTMFAGLAAGSSAAEETIKIGIMLIDSGPLAGLKDSEVKAANLAIEDVNAAGGAAGRKFEAVFVSYAGTPDSAVDGATRVVQKDGALFITGMSTSSAALALSTKMTSLKAIDIDTMAKSDALTGKACSANFFRVPDNDSMVIATFRDFVKEKNVKTWDMISVDYSVGHDTADKFKALVTAQGGSIGRSVFTPSGTSDFGAKISELGAEPADGLLVTIFGSDAVNLAKQQQSFGLFKKYKFVLGNNFVIPQTLNAQGETVLGVYQPQGFVPGFPGAQAEAFVKAYRAKYNGEAPPFTGADLYVGIQLMAAAVNQAKSTDIDAVRAALAGLKADTILGNVEIRAADHQLIRPVAMTTISLGADGKPAYQITKIEPGSAIAPPVDPACKM